MSGRGNVMKESRIESLQSSVYSGGINTEENKLKEQQDDDVYVLEDDSQYYTEEEAQGKKESVSEEPQIFASKEVMYEKGEMEPDQYRNAYIVRENMNQDAVKLGSKVRFKPNPVEKEKNRLIDKSRAITKKATLYTVEVSESVLASNEHMEEIAKELSESTVNEKTERYLQILDDTHFTAKMFSSAYIRKHLKDCLNVVNSFDELKELYKSGYRPDLGDFRDSGLMTEKQAKRVDDYRDIMALFSKRVNEFVKKNHIDITNGKGYDGELTDIEKTSDDNYRDWLSLVGDEKAKRKEQRMRENLADVTGNAFDEFTDEEILTEATVPKEVDIDEFREKFDLENALSMTSAQRVENYSAMKAFVKGSEEFLSSGQLTDSESDMYDAEHIRQSIRQAKVIIKLTEVEMEIARFRIKEGPEALADVDTFIKKNPQLAKRYGQVRDDIRKYYKKYEFYRADDERTMPTDLQRLTRDEALSTYSDKKSFDARMDLLRLSDAVKKKLGGTGVGDKLTGAVENYFDKNFHKYGSKAESDALLKLIKVTKDKDVVAFAKDHPEHPEINAVLAKISSLTTGNLEVPKDAEVIDKSHGERPETKGKRSFGHWFAKPLEDFYKLFRKWDKPENDTPLFAHEPTVNDLRQGKVSNCWMVAGTSALVNYDPNIIKNCMKDNGDGSVTVRLFKSGKDGNPTPMYIRVTKEVPKLITGGAIQSSGALWMQILEKAAAFIGYKKPTEQNENAGYDALWHGSQRDWIYALTGRMWDPVISASRNSVFVDEKAFLGKVEGISRQKNDRGTSDNHHLLDEKFKAQLFNQLIHARENGKVITYGSKMSNTPGMTAGHAYTVVSAGQDGEDRFVILRNPYGNMNAQYKDNGKLYQSDWYFSSVMNDTCGMFKIKYEDFLKNCGELSIIDMKADINKKKEDDRFDAIPVSKDPVEQQRIESNTDDF